MTTEVPGSRCPACGEAYAPPRPACLACGHAMDPTTFPPRGTLRTWTRVHRTPEGFDPGLVVGLVELDGGITVMALGPRDAEPALEAEVTLEEDADGRLRFRPG